MKSYEDFTIAVLGDFGLDRWLRGTASCLSPEAPVPDVTDVEKLEKPAMAGNVAINLSTLGAAVHAVGFVMLDNAGIILRDKLEAAGVNIKGMNWYSSKPTTLKTRIVANGQQVVRLNQEVCTPIHAEILAAESYMKGCTAFDAIVVADYNKGAVTPALTEFLRLWAASGGGVPIYVDPKLDDWSKYGNITLLKPNLKEWSSFLWLNRPSELGAEHIVVTKGADGIDIIKGYSDPDIHIPAHKVEVSDVTGAGDNVMAVLVLEHLRTGDIEKAAILANKAGSISVQHHGTYAVKPGELGQVCMVPDPSVIFPDFDTADEDELSCRGMPIVSEEAE